jgi:hypothetical protein
LFCGGHARQKFPIGFKDNSLQLNFGAMVNPAKLRLGNLLLWKAAQSSASSLPSTLVEIVSLQADRIGYVAPKIDQRVEPFEDDRLELQPAIAPPEQFKPVALTDKNISALGFVNGRKKQLYLTAREGGFAVYFGDALLCLLQDVHDLQNLYFILYDQELEVDFAAIGENW